MSAERIHVFFTGRVQGVGFRMTTVGLAAHRDVSGWIRNLDNGQVEMVAEGTRDELQRLLADIEIALGKYVRQTNVSWQAATGEFTGFQIRR